MRLLLGSGGHGPEDRKTAWIRELQDFLGLMERILFIPYALHDYDSYVAKMLELGFNAGYPFDPIHRHKNLSVALRKAPALFVGGGNTFRLLAALESANIIPLIQDLVLEKGLPYIGQSAGSNVACPTIKTTNDMPIVEPRKFAAFRFVPFQINPHYQDKNPDPLHRGESREDRIREFHEMNAATVVGMREGSILRVEGSEVSIRGTAGVRIFKKGEAPVEYAPGERLDFLLS